jgi:competence protein ComGC
MKVRYIFTVILFLFCAGFTLYGTEPAYLQVQQADNLINNKEATRVNFINRSDNPDFITPPKKEKPESFDTIKTLVPYEDLYKVLQQDIGKYFILPIEEFEALKKAKEAWLASQSQPITAPPPVLYQIHSARLEGRLEDNFAHIDAFFKIETHTDDWHEIPILWGSLAIEEVRLNGVETTLKTNWIDNSTRQVNFGKLSKQNILQNYYQSSLSSSEMLSQNNWKDTIFSLPIKGKNTHECRISFMVPVQNNEDLYTLQFNMAQIPLAFLKLQADDFTLSIDSTTFKDFSVDESSLQKHSCTFIGWLGAKSDVSLKWRRKYTRTQPKPEKAVTTPTASAANELQPQPESVTPEEPEVVIQPLVYARANTLISLGETSLQGFKTIDYSISKAPVSSFSFSLPENVEIISVNADRPHSYRQLRDGNKRNLRVEFMAGREDTCQIEIVYEAPVDLAESLIDIPEVAPIGVERELGAIAVEALTSVEVQPGNDDENPLNKGIYPLDPLEAPQPLKARATRPILLAYRQNARPSNILLKVKRYLDVNQQTVVADRMEVKTTFTTNKTSNTLLNMRIRNNNKQYLQLQLGSGTEVISAFRSGKPVKLVASKNDGKVQIPLEMSQTVGKPVEMNLQVLLKHPVDEIKWRGSLEFMPPMVDIPVSRFYWQIFAPEQYHLYNFDGTVKHSLTRKDPFFFRGFMTLLRLAWDLISSPDTLIVVVFIIFVILLIVAKKLLWRILKGIWAIISGIFSYIFSGKGFRLAELMFVFAIIGILFAIATPNFRKAREQSREKACYANMRVLTGAVEMYNMDNPQQMRKLNMNSLLKGKYLRHELYPPESGCRYESRGDLSGGGHIVCRLHGAVDADIEGLAPQEADYEVSSRTDFARETKMARQEMMKGDSFAPKAMPSAPSGGSYGAAKSKGMLPIQAKFIMTSNHYNLERDLVIADIASNGALVSNRTCPVVKVNYVWASALMAAEIFAFVLALFAGLYFISGAFLDYSSKISFAAIIILILSVVDLQLKSIGDMANMGLWLAIGGGFIWKIVWLVSKLNISFGGSGDSDDDNTPKPPKVARSVNLDDIKTADSDEPMNLKPDAGKVNPMILLVLVMVMSLGLSLVHAANTREIRVMAPFKELEKVVPTGDRVVIIPEKDYEYLKDIVEPEKPQIKAPQSYRFENVSYKGVIEEKGVRFKANFNLNLFNEGWKSIALLTTAAIPSYAGLDSKPLSLTVISGQDFPAYGFMTDATGTHKVELDFFVPLSSSEYKHTSKFNLPMIPVCLSTIELTANEEDCEAWIDPGVLKPAEKSAGKTVFKALLPPTNNLKFEIYRNVGGATLKPVVPDKEKPGTEEDTKPVVIEEKTRITAVESNLLYFKEGFVTGTNCFSLKIKGGNGIASLTFSIPEKIRILKVENKLIEDWKLLETEDQRNLEIFFKSRIRGNTELVIEFEQEIQNLKDENYQVPEIVLLDAEQSYGILGIGCLQTLEISVSSTPQGYSPIIAAEFLKEWKKGYPEKTPYAFKFLRHPNNLVLTITRPEDISQQTAVIDRAEALTLLNEDGYLLTRIVYEVRNNSQQFLKVRLPVIASKAAELWSTQVAGESVRAGFDETYKVYNLPIVRSPIENGESRSFPVEMVYVVKTDNPLEAFNQISIELPQTHLPVSELSWILYLPEGYELMKETGNVDRKQTQAQTKFLYNSSYFTSINTINQARTRKNQMIQQKWQYQKKGPEQSSQQDRIFGTTGLLPVKFSIPTTSWSTSFTMLQIEPEGRAPYIEGMLVNPRKGKGFLFQAVMILIGVFLTLGLVKLFTGKRKYLWFLFLVLQASIVALAIYLKLYQADHFAQLGFASSLSIYLLYLFFKFKPEENRQK